MSGGVDSSLAAALLVKQGYDVTGVYMKNWTADLPGVKCPWADDLADAKRVAVQLGINFKVFDFEKQYKQKVVDYMIDEYKNGHTPNPDIMCNQEVKFKLFLNTALEDGADMIATGHYARVFNTESAVILDSKQADFRHDDSKSDSLYSAELADAQTSSNSQESDLKSSGQVDSVSSSSITTNSASATTNGLSLSPIILSDHLQPEFNKASGPLLDPARSRSDGMNGEGLLLNVSLLKKAVDENKDQTYFLYRITAEALSKTLFPIGEFTKPEVRKMAEERGLTTAVKKDSQGICFVGQVGIRDFLSLYVDSKPGEIIDKKSGKTLGFHEGAIFYTFGQRHGLDIGGGMPYYVVGKNMEKNEVYVTTDLNDETLWKKTINLGNLHWINQAPGVGEYQIRVRHRAHLINARLNFKNDNVILKLDNPERAIAPGQSIVIYNGEICLGGGIIV